MVFPSTGVKLSVLCLLGLVMAICACGDGSSVPVDGDVDMDREDELSEYTDVECGYPAFTFEIPEDEMFPQPLDLIRVNACNHELKAVGGEVCGPYWYFWDWLPGGLPSRAVDTALIILPDGSKVHHQSFMRTWTRVCNPGFYFPVPGQYGIRVKLRNAVGMESGGSSDCSDCEGRDNWIAISPSGEM